MTPLIPDHVKRFIAISLLLLLAACTPPAPTETNVRSKAELTYLADGKLRHLELYGKPYARGLAHGRLLKDDIKAVTDSLLLDIERTAGGDPRDFITRFLAETDFVTAIKTHTPELLEEIKGIADGSGIDHDIIMMHQLGDEFFFNSEYIFAHKCSSIGINKTDNHPAIAAQNMDIPHYFHGYQTVMHITESDGRESIVLTIPGHIGITGMSSAPVSINCNILMQLDYARKGLPVSFIVRGVLKQNSYEEARDFLHRIPHASAQNYLIGGEEQVGSFECSATAITEFRPFAEAPFTYHTNHPLTNESFSVRYYEILEEHGVSLEEAMTFCQRLPSFQQRFDSTTTDFGIAEIMEVLSSRDHEGVDVLSNSLTYASVVYELSANPVFHIAPGKPHETAYEELVFGK
ncbi:MAG: C45 family autoproteolytic acyltransferase/hydrolase [Cryomorphaceae bacterium]|nr:C45 family peptidase [Flavobacteriales bacterium]